MIRWQWAAALAFFCVMSGVAYGGTPGASGDTTADRVLGQPDFTHNGLNSLSASGLNVGGSNIATGGHSQNNTAGMFVDNSGHLYIADTFITGCLATSMPAPSPVGRRPTS